MFSLLSWVFLRLVYAFWSSNACFYSVLLRFFALSFLACFLCFGVVVVAATWFSSRKAKNMRFFLNLRALHFPRCIHKTRVLNESMLGKEKAFQSIPTGKPAWNMVAALWSNICRSLFTEENHAFFLRFSDLKKRCGLARSTGQGSNA